MPGLNGSNALTLLTYAQRSQDYIAGTVQEVSGPVKEWIDVTLALVDKEQPILELGSAFGRDATYMQDRGYTVRCTDAVPEFIAVLQARGLAARLCNALIDDLGSGYSLIFANAVFLHFTPTELELVLSKVRASLRESGLLAFSVKRGNGCEWSTQKMGAPRYFCYWQEPDLQKFLIKAGFSICLLQQDETWIRVVAQKQ